jgi:Tol biopolymer transport system component
MPTEQSATRISTSDLAGFKGLGWTPDGKVVYTTAVNSIELWRMNADGSDAQKLISAPYDAYLPVVSPDNRYIVYVSDIDGAYSLWRADMPDGGNRVQLTRGVTDEAPQITPDGKWIIFMQTIEGRSRLAKVSIDGGEVVPLGQMTAKMPAVSPDGKTIAFILIDQAGAKIALMPIDGNYPTKIFETHFPVVGKPYFSTVLQWSPDGNAVNFIREENGVSNVWSQPVAGGAVKKITSFGSEEIFYFSYARDDSRLALSRGSQFSDVILITLSE